MSFSIEEGTPLCVIRGGDSDGEIIFVTQEDSSKSKVVKNHPVRKIKVSDGKFQHIPNDKVRVLYVSAPSGSGKSTYVAEYAKLFKKLYPDCRIILFSRIDNDPAFDDLCYKKIILTDELAENPLQLEEATPGSLIIFDDIDTISNKRLLHSILNFQSQLLEMGRHSRIGCIITSHLINGVIRNQTKTIMNEMQSLTVFPQSGSVKQIRYVLEQYFGFTRDQIDKVLKMDSRWITIFKNYPQILMSEKSCMFVSQL